MCVDAGALGAIGAVTSVVGAYSNYQSQMQQAAYAKQVADVQATYAQQSAAAQAAYAQKQAAAQAQAYQQQAEISRQNAAIENKKAETDVDAGADRVAELRRRALATLGTQRATMGALGLATTGGSPDKILSDTEYEANLDIEALRFNNRATKWGHDVNRVNYLNDAIMSESAAANAKWSGDAQAANIKWAGDVNASTTRWAGNVQASNIEYGARTSLLTSIASTGVDYMGKYGSSSYKTSTPKINTTYNRSTGWESPKTKIIRTIPGWKRV